MQHEQLVLERPTAPDLALTSNFSTFDERFMKLHGIDARGTGVSASPLSEQAPDPFGLNRVATSQETTQDPFGLNRSAPSQDRFAGINDLVNRRTPPLSAPELPSSDSLRESAEAQLDLGNWREAVARQEEEKFLNEARAAAVIAIEASGLFQAKFLEDLLHQQKDQLARDDSYDARNPKKKKPQS